MPSQVWGHDPQEAFEEPYEYAVQEQFVREARVLFRQLYKLLCTDRHRYSVNDCSLEKAVWLLAMDALDSLRESLEALVRKEHRVAGKLFRDVMESMDRAAYFYSDTQKSRTSLERWYADKIIGHAEYRDYVKRAQGTELANKLKKHYESLSRFTHRSYRAILNGYSRGAGDRLVHDRSGELFGKGKDAGTFLVLPQTVASYFAVLANLTLEYLDELSELSLATQNEIREAFAASLESETVPRRFLPRRWLVEKLQHLPRPKATQPSAQSSTSHVAPPMAASCSNDGGIVEKEEARIAILGWGSLLWEGGSEFDKWHEPWEYDGPELDIEFSRISDSRLGALTLVIDPEHGSSTRVAWCLSRRVKVEDAVADLRCREGTTIQNIGCIRVSQQPSPPDRRETEESIVAWARGRKLDAVVWTALKSNFEEKTRTPFSVKAAIAYVKTLSPAAKAKAAEYVWRAPEFVQTPVRHALQAEPWFPKQAPRHKRPQTRG